MAEVVPTAPVKGVGHWVIALASLAVAAFVVGYFVNKGNKKANQS